MGQFSWKTQDTNKSISCLEQKFKVVMRDNHGNKWVEEDYQGYGVFGGKDYYDLLAEMNGFSADNLPEGFNELRLVGLKITFDNLVEHPIYPSLTEDGSWHDGKQPECCPHQGWIGRSGKVGIEALDLEDY